MHNTKEAIVLIGHGAAASDTPRKFVDELKKLEMERRRRQMNAVNGREIELDRLVRQWPRTPQNDPYKSGLEQIALALEAKLSGRRLILAYNEFCAPSVEEAIAALADQGIQKITLITTMYTRGGLHSEKEIPSIVRQAQKKYPNVRFHYAWPFDTIEIANFLAHHLKQSVNAH
ncbi:MAG: CbiX/SirB N-terminal domain-containing protein [Elusimicrobia bacterium]|nr:CbiX/SirB N-terminal domain-containing protein [Elusimicrobiota bacterium]